MSTPNTEVDGVTHPSEDEGVGSSSDDHQQSVLSGPPRTAPGLPLYAPIAFPQMDTYSPTSVVVLNEMDDSLSGSMSRSGRLSRLTSRFTFNPVVRRGPVSATLPVSIERDIQPVNATTEDNVVMTEVVQVVSDAADGEGDAMPSSIEGGDAACTVTAQEAPMPTGAGLDVADGDGQGVPVIREAVPNYDADHILTLTPDEIRLYWVWKSSKRILWLTLISMCLTAFWILRFRQAFTLILIPLLGYYAARGYSMIVSSVYAVAQLLPILARAYVLYLFAHDNPDAAVDPAMAALYIISMVVEVLLLVFAIKFVLQLRHCTSIEVRLLQAVYHYTFRTVERESEGFWAC